MHLSCLICGHEATPQPSPNTAPDGPLTVTHLDDGTPLCAAPGAPQWPSWPDARYPPAGPHTIASDTVAIPRHHPCRLAGTPIPAPPGTATVTDRDGGIDCPATAATGGCPWVASPLSRPDHGGLAAGGGCWLRALAPYQAVFALHRAGIALPHRIPGFVHDYLDPRLARVLAAWLAAHHDRFLALVGDAGRRDAATVLTYSSGWLMFAAETGRGVRTERLTRAHAGRVHRAAPASAPDGKDRP